MMVPLWAAKWLGFNGCARAVMAGCQMGWMGLDGLSGGCQIMRSGASGSCDNRMPECVHEGRRHTRTMLSKSLAWGSNHTGLD